MPQTTYIPDSFDIQLPQPWSLLSHVDNVDYAITRLRSCLETLGPDYVIGYHLAKGPGIRELFHRLMTKQDAELQKQIWGDSFCVKTLEDLLRRKRDIDFGVFELHDGHIVWYADRGFHLDTTNKRLY